MALSLRPLHPVFAAEAAGIDPARPMGEAEAGEVRRALDDYAVIVFRNARPLTDEQHIAFSGRFGPLQEMKLLTMLGKSKTRLGFRELIDVGNLDVDGTVLAADDRRRQFGQGNLLWHTDVSFDPVRAVYSFLSAHVVPPGGADTEFADMRAAYDRLPEAMKARLEGLTAEHSIWYSRMLAGMTEVSEDEKATRPPARHALVHVHPTSGRKALYLASHASRVLGMPEAAGRALLDELMGHATRPERVYRHAWRPGDLVIWDNLATMHRATPFDDLTEPRDMRRTTVLEAG